MDTLNLAVRLDEFICNNGSEFLHSFLAWFRVKVNSDVPVQQGQSALAEIYRLDRRNRQAVIQEVIDLRNGHTEQRIEQGVYVINLHFLNFLVLDL